MKKLDPQSIKRRFLARLWPRNASEALFDHLPDVCFFAKDRQRRYVLCNRSFVELVRLRCEDDVIGQVDKDFSPHDLCENYERDDLMVLTTGQALVDRVELVRNPDGSIDWYNTTKVPVRDRRGTVVGLMGITRDIKKMKSTNARFLSLAPAIESIVSAYPEALPVTSLAAKVGLSVSQFERQFKKKFGTTPRKYINQIRVDAACRLLASTTLPLVDVAMETGFYDHSHLTKEFIRRRGQSPAKYRRRHGGVA